MFQTSNELLEMQGIWKNWVVKQEPSLMLSMQTQLSHAILKNHMSTYYYVTNNKASL
jgi:hypothetical protein